MENNSQRDGLDLQKEGDSPSNQKMEKLPHAHNSKNTTVPDTPSVSAVPSKKLQVNTSTGKISEPVVDMGLDVSPSVNLSLDESPHYLVSSNPALLNVQQESDPIRSKRSWKRRARFGHVDAADSLAKNVILGKRSTLHATPLNANELLPGE
ncbi:hypothetical protein ACOSP7_028710 [Xanthoceras sorbifolium]